MYSFKIPPQFRHFLQIAVWILAPLGFMCQAAETPASASGNSKETFNWTAREDHKNMMDQLGIKTLRPGPSGQPGATNSANYDPAKANPYPDLPDPLTLRNGQKVTTPEM